MLDATSLPSVNDDICEAQMQRQVVDAINRFLLREVDSIEVMTRVMELIVCLSACSKPAVSLQIRGAMSSMVKYWKAKIVRGGDLCVRPAGGEQPLLADHALRGRDRDGVPGAGHARVERRAAARGRAPAGVHHAQRRGEPLRGAQRPAARDAGAERAREEHPDFTYGLPAAVLSVRAC